VRYAAKRTAGLAALLVAMVTGCVPSNIVAVEDRMVIETPVIDQPWEPANRSDLVGLFESLEIHGEAAAALWKVYYHFSADGGYSGAALVAGDDGVRFQVLSGTWTFTEDGRVDLGDGSEPLQARVSGGFLQLESAAGTVVFRREGDL